MGFAIGFFVFYLTLTEFNTGASAESAAVLFKRGSKAAVVQDAESEVKNDVEKPNGSSASSSAQTEVDEAREAAAAAPAMTDVFSWHHLNYTIPLGHGETRKLLDDVSGYVAPGKLTALVGSSGAGKVCLYAHYMRAVLTDRIVQTTLLNTLAERTDIGVVTGSRHVNGHPLPPDFQAQT